MRIASITYDSTVDGPGRRTVIHFQGCSIQCVGCANQHLWDLKGGTARSPASLSAELLRHWLKFGKPDGLTLSGGEPFDQPVGYPGLRQFFSLIRPVMDSVVVYTGYVLEGLLKKDPSVPILLYQDKAVDVLVDGPFLSGRTDCSGLRGSANQRFHFLTSRHRPEEFGVRKASVEIGPGGSFVIRGFPDPKLEEVVRCKERNRALTAGAWPDGS